MYADLLNQNLDLQLRNQKQSFKNQVHSAIESKIQALNTAKSIPTHIIDKINNSLINLENLIKKELILCVTKNQIEVLRQRSQEQLKNVDNMIRDLAIKRIKIKTNYVQKVIKDKTKITSEVKKQYQEDVRRISEKALADINQSNDIAKICNILDHAMLEIPKIKGFANVEQVFAVYSRNMNKLSKLTAAEKKAYLDKMEVLYKKALADIKAFTNVGTITTDLSNNYKGIKDDIEQEFKAAKLKNVKRIQLAQLNKLYTEFKQVLQNNVSKEKYPDYLAITAVMTAKYRTKIENALKITDVKGIVKKYDEQVKLGENLLTKLGQAVSEAQRKINDLKYLTGPNYSIKKQHLTNIDNVYLELEQKLQAVSESGIVKDKATAYIDEKIQVINDIVKKAQFQNEQEGAKEELEEVSNNAHMIVQNMKYLDSTKQSEISAKITKITEETTDKIDQAKELTQITTEKTKGINAIKALLNQAQQEEAEQAEKALAESKTAAKQAIADKAKAAKATINGLKDLTEADKQAKADAVDQAVTKANEAIDKATKDQVAGEQSKGETAIDQVVTAAKELDAAKAAAKQAIADKAKAAKATINGLKDLTEFDKKAKTAEVDQAVTEANAAIEKATKSDVETATEAGKSAIDQVVTAAKELDAAKTEAKQAIADKAKEAKATIAGLKDLTEADKKAKAAEVDQAVTEANAAIDKATKDEVASEQSKGETTIDQIVKAAQDLDSSK
uniref:DUF1542 domain-containing protein n=1 Tax=Ligilactobacillus ceti TaxID=395085 RepID=UPI0005525E3F